MVKIIKESSEHFYHYYYSDRWIWKHVIFSRRKYNTFPAKWKTFGWILSRYLIISVCSVVFLLWFSRFFPLIRIIIKDLIIFTYNHIVNTLYQIEMEIPLFPYEYLGNFFGPLILGPSNFLWPLVLCPQTVVDTDSVQFIFRTVAHGLHGS